MCPRSLDPFYIVAYYIKWAKTYWTYSISTVLDLFTISYLVTVLEIRSSPKYTQNKVLDAQEVMSIVILRVGL